MDRRHRRREPLPYRPVHGLALRGDVGGGPGDGHHPRRTSSERQHRQFEVRDALQHRQRPEHRRDVRLVRGCGQGGRGLSAGRFPFTAPDGAMTVSVLDVASGTSTGLTAGVVDRLQRIIDTAVGLATPGSFDYADSIRQAVPLPLLGLSARRVPIGILATDLDSGEVDEASFVFELSRSPGVGAVQAGFNANSLPANDDQSSQIGPPRVRRELLRRHLHRPLREQQRQRDVRQTAADLHPVRAHVVSAWRSSPRSSPTWIRARETSSPTETVSRMGGRPSG